MIRKRQKLLTGVLLRTYTWTDAQPQVWTLARGMSTCYTCYMREVLMPVSTMAGI